MTITARGPSRSTRAGGWSLIAGDDGATGVTSYEIDVDPRGNVALPPLPQGTPLEFGSIVGGVGVVQPTHYRFSLTQETLVYFDARTDDSRLLWSLTGPAGTVVADRLFTASDSVDQTGSVAFLLRAGDYDISIRTSDDSTAFCVHAACHLLAREQQPGPSIVEFTSYHNHGGGMKTGEFLSPTATQQAAHFRRGRIKAQQVQLDVNQISRKPSRVRQQAHRGH